MRGNKKNIFLFFIIIATVSAAIGFSDLLFSNYFREVYNIDGYQRGLIEFPRELPGILTLLVISAVAFLGNIRIAIIAQALAATGLFVLGLFEPSYNIMLVFLFINSMGYHMYMPLRDSIGMALAEEDKVGRRMGQFASMRFAFLMVSMGIAFFLFKFRIFDFSSNIKWTFLVSAFLYVVSMAMLIKLSRDVGRQSIKTNKFRIVFRKEYKFYYILAVVFGVQKQVMLVFGPWVLIETLGQQVDTIVLLGIIAAALGMGFMIQLGKWIDKYGVKRLLFFDAASFIVVYLLYGFMCMGFANGLSKVGLPLILMSGLLVLDRLSAQMGVIRTVYLKSIIRSE